MTLAAELSAKLGDFLEPCKSRFSDNDAWSWLGKEIAHIDRDDAVDVRLTKKVIRENRETLENLGAEFRPNASDWVVISLTKENLDDVVEWVVQQLAR